MSSAAEIQRIIQAVGPHQRGDHKLRPADHAAGYSELPELQQRLNDSKVVALAEEYDRYSSKAVVAQRKYKKYSKYARWCIFFTAAFSAGLVMVHSLADANWVPAVRMTLAVLSGVFGILASTFLMLLKGLKLLDVWMKSRATAEKIRLDYFEEICELPKEHNISFTLAQLEYFRRYHLEMQKDYYQSRSESLGNRSTFSVTLIAILTAVAGFATLLVGILGEFSTTMFLWVPIVVAISLIIQAFASMITNREQTEQNQRNAARYDHSRSALNKLSGQLTDVREGIAQGHVELLPKFVQAVNEPLAQEHSQWLDEMDKHNAALSALESELSDVVHKQ